MVNFSVNIQLTIYFFLSDDELAAKRTKMKHYIWLIVPFG